MPIYAVDEHELMKEDSTLREGDAEIQDGTLYLTDRRLIYEKKGTRGLLKATPAKTYMDVYLHELKNVSASVPRIRAFTKKYLRVEFDSDGNMKKYDFLLSNPRQWNDEIVRWVSDARRHKEDDDRKRDEEKHKKDVELANAKSPKTNIGMAYFGEAEPKPRRGRSPRGNVEEEQISGGAQKTITEPKYVPLLCDSCGAELKPEMKFCSQCGKKVTQ